MTTPEDVTNGDFNKQADAKARVAAQALYHPDDDTEAAWSGIVLLVLVLGMCGAMAVAAYYLNTHHLPHPI